MEPVIHGNYNLGPNYDDSRPYEPTWDTVPVPGISSGMLPSGMNFDYLPPQAPVMQMVRLDQPSPLQQFVSLGGKRGDDPADPSQYGPMRTCHMIGDAGIYNGLVGDVVKVSKKTMQGLSTLLFDLRIPLDNRMQWWPDMVKEQDHCGVPPSQEALASAGMNARIIRPEHNLYDKESGRTPPYLMIKKLPFEKLHPLGSANHGFARQGPPGVEMLPAITGKAQWGPPVRPVPPGYMPAPNDMPGMMPPSVMDSGVMPPNMPWSAMGGPRPPMSSMGMMAPPGSMPPGMMPPGSMPPGSMRPGMPPMNPFMSGQSMYM